MRRQLEKGMTFVEILVGMLIFSLIFVGFSHTLSFSKNLIMQMSETTAATKLLSEAVEIVRGESFSTVDGWGIITDQDFETVTGATLASKTLLPSGACFITIGQYDNGGGPLSDLLEVTIYVQWTHATGGTRTMEVCTMVTDGGLNG